MDRAFLYGMINHIVLLLALVFLYSQLIRRWGQGSGTAYCATGVLFGGVAVITMLFPLPYAPGVFLDVRTILLGGVGLIAGPAATAVAVALTVALEIWRNGAAMLVGVAVILPPALLGLAVHRYRLRFVFLNRPVALYIFGLAVHVATLACLWVLADPAQRRTVTEILRPVLLTYPVITMLFARLLVSVEERWQGLASLQRSQDFLTEIINAAGDPLFVKDGQHRWVLVNDAFCDLWRHSREELIGRSDPDVHAPELAAVFWERDDEVFCTGRNSAYEERLIDGRGRERVVVTRKSRYIDRYGNSYIVGTVRDITEQKAAETLRMESEERYRAMIQQSLDAILIVDIKSKRVLESNAQCVILLGYSEEEIANLRVYDLVVDTRDNIDRRIQMILSGIELPSRLLRIRRKDGRIIEAERSATTIQYGGKKVFMFAVRDISAERKMQGLILRDVSMAADVQKALIPRGFDDMLLSVRTLYTSFHVVSGDFYDFGWSQDHQKFSGFILDVSGHGVSSSLQGIAVSAYFREILNSPMSLDAKLKWINQRVLRYFTDETYAAAICFEFDFSRKLLNYATAGIYGFLASSDTLPPMVRQSGSFVGIMEDPEYLETSVPFSAGDSFYFMSDGIFDQVSKLPEPPLGDFERTVQALGDLAESPLRKDDCTAVCIRISGQPSFPLCLETHRAGDYQRVRARIRNVLGDVAGYEAGKVFIALGEALNNAARESTDIRVKLNLLGRRLVIRVRDSGAGFDGNRFVQSVSQRGISGVFEERLGAEGGRGIMIMLSWMDRVVYSRDGREVLLMKRLTRCLDAAGDS